MSEEVLNVLVIVGYLPSLLVWLHNGIWLKPVKLKMVIYMADILKMILNSIETNITMVMQ